MIRCILINLRFEGIHCWSTCDVETEMYLRFPHRHIFHIQMQIEVSHNNRDIEIIALKRRVLSFLLKKFPDRDLGEMSCEDLCELLLLEFSANYVSVLEDGENGATIQK